MSNSLFDITAEFKAFYEMLTNTDSEPIDQEMIEATLEGMKFELEAKAEGYIAIINQLQMEADACEDRVKFFQEKQRIRSNAILRMKKALCNALIETGNESGLNAGEYTLKVQKNGGVQPLVIDGEVPQNMTKVVIEPDNKKIRDFLKDNTCEWAHLEPRGVHLAIK